MNIKTVSYTHLDSLIEKLTPTSPVLAWLLDYIDERIRDDKRWNVSNEVKSCLLYTSTLHIFLRCNQCRLRQFFVIGRNLNLFPIFVVSLTPVIMAVFAAQRAKGKEPSTPRKIAIGMGLSLIHIYGDP